MLRITDAVKEIVLHDGYAIEGIQKGILNLSSYAKTIHSAVEEKCMKPVQMGSIVVALTRLSDSLHENVLSPRVTIERFSITSNLCEITYERTDEVQSTVLSIPSQLEKTGDFFTITQGMHEITIICSENLRDQVLSSIQQAPKATMSGLVALCVRFPGSYITVPNTIYSLVGILALRHINIMEIISTFTELSFIIQKNEMTQAIEALDEYADRSLPISSKSE